MGGHFLWTGKQNLSTNYVAFTKPLIMETRKVVRQYAFLWMSTLNCPEYCNAVKKFIENEEYNINYWLYDEPDSNTLDAKTLVLKIMHQEMITNMA